MNACGRFKKSLDTIVINQTDLQLEQEQCCFFGATAAKAVFVIFIFHDFGFK